MIIYPGDLESAEDEVSSTAFRELATEPPKPWRAPPRAWTLPAILPWTALLGEGEDVRVALAGVWVWPDGVTFDLLAVARRLPFEPVLGDDGLWLAVVFADGRRTTLSRPATWSSRPAGPPDAPVLRREALVDNGFCRYLSMYLWPLPPRGPLTFVVSWPDRGVPESTRQFDAAAIAPAAQSAVPIW